MTSDRILILVRHEGHVTKVRGNIPIFLLLKILVLAVKFSYGMINENIASISLLLLGCHVQYVYLLREKEIRDQFLGL